MSQSPSHQALFTGSDPSVPIATGSWTTKALDIEERRRVNFTINFGGGHTGTLLIQGTDEISQCNGCPGNPGAGSQPGTNGLTGALYWNTVPSGTVLITNSTQSIMISLVDVGPAFIRLAYNAQSVAVPSLAVGSGVISAFYTAKNA